MVGADAGVPPTVTHAPMKRTFTPVSGAATAETWENVRFPQPVSVCQDGLGSKALQPLPAPDHADSVQPRAVDVLRVSDVPPTAVRNGEEAGDETPKPLSPELAVIAMPGWLKWASLAVSSADSSPPQLLLIAFAPSRAAVSSAA